ncbi:MgtC/SapB family protein [Labrys wisconsinensis]|uniref:Protein MgtC n=1 Tax=Labrys wisconsinensis TaxID=425677 RepID=A0ABU0IZQ9_9HYPH|nr:MgtC/SapB family protein [Labrys wisconsinensis]MDQ0467493.1 putative Mg2+ transporter-C (MgtC) family protein [Labrys wisconsinensis]
MTDAPLDLVARLVVGMLAGMLIGLNRVRHRRGVGMRTLGLVGLGSAVAVAIFQGAADANAASRAVQGILTGVGFLGAGVILHRTNEDVPRGLTTAAATWVTAMLGAAAGAGAWLLVGTGVVLAVVLLAVGERVERLFGGRADRDEAAASGPSRD